MSSGSMMSKAGNSQIYEDNEQRTYKKHETDPDRFEAGQENAHSLLDSKDERSIANNLAAYEKAALDQEKEEKAAEEIRSNPLKPALDHGNNPSRGAEIDAEIQQEEEEYLKRKGRA